MVLLYDVVTIIIVTLFTDYHSSHIVSISFFVLMGFLFIQKESLIGFPPAKKIGYKTNSKRIISPTLDQALRRRILFRIRVFVSIL